ncbi:MAG: ABC transporter substrate-binding protein [Bacillota bacterium]|nr:ABC transporter substrate-binding protein [Bacillota bacterium]
MRSRFVVGILVLSLAFGWFGSVALAAEPIVFGLSAPITGANATWGDIMRNHVGLAVEEINAKGGILGRPIKLVVEDNQSTVTGGIVAFQKLISQNPNMVAIAGLTFSNMVLGLMPYVAQEKIPCIVNASNPKITYENNGYMIRTYMNDAVAAEIATRYAYEKLGKKVAILNNSNEMGTAGGKAIADTLKKYYNAKPVAWEQYNTGDKDFSGQLMKIAAAGADVIVHWGHALEAALIMKQRVALGLTNIDLVGSPDHAIATTLDLAKENANGVYSIINFIPQLKGDPKVSAYVERFQKRFGILPDSHSALYDGVYMLKAAIEKVGAKGLEGDIKAVRQRITNALYGMKYDGVVADYFVAPNGDALWELMIVKIVDGTKKDVRPVEKFRTEPSK